MKSYNVLLTDDDNSLRIILSESLLRAGYEVTSLKNTTELMDEVKSGRGDIVITDVIMPDGDGIELIPKIKKIREDLPIIVMSARSNLQTAIRSNQKGAFEYLPKPFDINDLLSTIKRALESELQNKENSNKIDFEDSSSLIGSSKSMQAVFKIIAKVVSNDFSVLILGESGTGKEVIAKTIHELSNRKNKSFVALNMAAIPKELIESELFGHEKGAFTGATNRYEGKFGQANNGTLFLDEIGDMPPSAQTKLLRVLQEKEYTPIGGKDLIKTNARIISASQNPLEKLVENGVFRKDLFFRLNVIPIFVPPLRDRKCDIPLLVNYFLKKLVKEGFPEKYFSSKASDLLIEYSWPGNIRELENFIKRLIIINSDREISSQLVKEHLHLDIQINSKKNIENNNLSVNFKNLLNDYFSSYKPNLPPSGLYNKVINEIDKPLIEICLTVTGGNQHKAALLLGINRNTLRKKIKDLKI